jgi:hypothetical protein
MKIVVYLLFSAALFITVAASLAGCNQDIVQPAHAESWARAEVSTQFRYIHRGCPTNLVVWAWSGDVVVDQVQFYPIDHDTILTFAADRTSWFLTVLPNKPREYKIEGNGDSVAFTQGGCFAP